MEILDFKGLKCPLPILKTKKVLATKSQGERISVLTTDKSSPVDFSQFCKQTGHILVSCEEINDSEYFQILIEHK